MTMLKIEFSLSGDIDSLVGFDIGVDEMRVGVELDIEIPYSADKREEFFTNIAQYLAKSCHALCRDFNTDSI